MASQATIPYFSKFGTSLAFIAQTLFMLFTLSSPITGEAAIFSCQSGESIIYQDRPCPRKKHVEKARKQVHNYPLSIHESWFTLPEQAEERAFCDRRGCECGRIEKKHQGTLAQTVADALYLDGSWHRYDTNYFAWLESPSSSQESHELRVQMLEASCDIMMSQVLLRNHAADIVQNLKKRVRTAEERGFDVKEPCLQGIPEACAFYDSVELLSRMLKDAKALRRSRDNDLKPGQESLIPSQASSDP